MTTVIAPELLALQRLYAWESEAPTRVALTQPMGDGSVRDFTWGELAGEVRRMAAHFRAGVDNMVREAELEELKKEWEEQNRRIMAEFPDTVDMTPGMREANPGFPDERAPRPSDTPPPAHPASDPPGVPEFVSPPESPRAGKAFLRAHPAHFLAFGGGIGLSRVAPGTMGTLAMFPLFWVLDYFLNGLEFLLFIDLLFVVGIWACGVTGRALGNHDHGGMVLDEMTAFLLVLYTGLGVILGHNYPFYLNFKGGKGIAATAGLIVALDLRLMVVTLVAFVLIVAVTRFVSLGSLVVATIFLAWMIVMGSNGSYGVSAGHLPEFYIVAAVISAQAFWRHRANIVRLVHGNENKISFGKK